MLLQPTSQKFKLLDNSWSNVQYQCIHCHWPGNTSTLSVSFVWTRVWTCLDNSQTELIICFSQLTVIWEKDLDGCIILLWNGTPTSIGGALKLILRFLVLIFYLASEWWLWCAGARSLCNQTPNIISPASQTRSRWCTAHYAIVLELRHALELEPWHAIECQHHISTFSDRVLMMYSAYCLRTQTLACHRMPTSYLVKASRPQTAVSLSV